MEVLIILQRIKKNIRKDNDKSCAAGDLYRQRNERVFCKCFRCGSVDHLIAKCLKPPKDNKKQQNTFRFNERVNRVPQKESKDGDDDNDQYIYASMARMYDDDEKYSRYFGDSSQLTNWILD